MTWFRVDDKFHNHPKVMRAGNAAVGLFVRCCTWSAAYETDGHVPQEIVDMYGTKAEAAAVARVGLWEQEEGGVIVPDFLEFNPSRDELKAERDKRSTRARAGARARWGSNLDAQSNAHSNASSNAPSMRQASDAPMLRPVPSRPSSSSPTDTHDTQSYPQDDEKIRAVVQVIADTQTSNAKNLSNPTAYRNKCAKNAHQEHAQEIARLTTKYPTARPQQIAAYVLGEKRALATVPSIEEPHR